MAPFPKFYRTLSSALFASAVASACLCTACEEPKEDLFRAQGGIAPDPSGIIEGTVVYLGPKPDCDYGADGKPTRVRGRVVMTLFEYDNPPPPEGTATSAKNLLYVPAKDMFTVDDCAPRARPPERIMRSAPFRWPTIALDEKKAVRYQIRSFYDYDEDMNPFFNVKNLPTAGDIAGGALVDIQDASKGFLPITMPKQEDAKKGFIFGGVTVALGSYVWTERPMFRLSENRVLSAEAFVEVAVKNLAPDVPGTVRNLWNLSCASPSAGAECGLSIQTIPKSEIGSLLEYAGVEMSFRKDEYSFFVRDVDVRTIGHEAPDVVRPDGKPDPHPILGANLGITWSTPMTIFSRLPLDSTQAAIEAQAGIPGVTMVGTVLPDEVETKKAFSSSINVAVAPVAAVTLSTASPLCRVAYAAPGNTTRTFESRVINCGELPTGMFGVNVLSGVAGGERVPEQDTNVSEAGVLFTGSDLRFSGQVWSVPNPLGDEAQVDTHAVGYQGARSITEDGGWAYSGEGLFIVHDPHPGPEPKGSCDTAPDPDMPMFGMNGEVTFGTRPVKLRGLCKEGQKSELESPDLAPGLPDIDGAACLPDVCCEAVAHLCDVPLCDTVEVTVGGKPRTIRSGPTKIERVTDKGQSIPNCIPFEMPKACCGKLP